VRSIRVVGNPYYEPTTVVHDEKEHTEERKCNPQTNLTTDQC